MKEKVRKVGIIGCGGIARVHVNALRDMENVSLVAFCDSDLEKAESLAGCDCLVCDDWRELCESDLDVIHVCTPHYLHAQMAIEILKSGKAAFVEKPCAISMKQFAEIEDEDRKHPGMLGFCFQNRYNESTHLIDRIIGEDRIGKLTGGRAMVTWRRDEDYYSLSSWKGKKETEGGGVLINQSIHTLDLLLKYLGEPVCVRGNCVNHHLTNTEVDIEDTVEAWMEFKGGERACFYASNAYVTDAPVYLELQGEKGRICMNGAEVSVYINGKTPECFQAELRKGIGKDYWGCSHKACIEDFYQSLDSGDVYINSISGVKNTFRTVMEIYGGLN